jgi:hypothetical protein
MNFFIDTNVLKDFSHCSLTLYLPKEALALIPL